MTKQGQMNVSQHEVQQQQQIQQQQMQQIQQQQTQSQQQAQPLRPNQIRAIHRINLSSIRHNYHAVQSSASQQQCQVIVVVKADGYGHGAILTACHLVEHCNAAAFAVATLEEGISLRRAFEEKFNPIVGNNKVRILVLGAPVGYPNCFDSYLHFNIELMVSGPEVATSLTTWMKNHDGRRRAEVERVAEQRKEELMDDCGKYGIGEFRHPMRNRVVRQISENRGEANGELLKQAGDTSFDDASGKADESTCNTTVTSNVTPTVEDEQHHASRTATPPPSSGTAQQDTTSAAAAAAAANAVIKPQPVSPSKLQTKYNAATLTNVTGDDLAREVRQILIGQRHATAKATMAAAASGEGNAMATIPEPVEESRDNVSRKNSDAGEQKQVDQTVTAQAGTATTTTSAVASPAKKAATTTEGGGALFCGIDDAARASRQRELRAARLSQLEDGNSSDEGSNAGIPAAGEGTSSHFEPPQIRKKLRWHALVDSGMGRLGFKTEVQDESSLGKPDPQARLVLGIGENEDLLSDGSISSSSEFSGVRDTVSIIKNLYDAEVHEGAPIGKTCALEGATSSEKCCY